VTGRAGRLARHILVATTATSGPTPEANDHTGPAVSGAMTAVGVVLVALAMRQPVAGVPPILADLGLSPTAAALLVAIPVLCFSLGALAGPLVRARLGEERTIFAMVAVVVGGLLLRAVWPTWGLFPGTILAGLAIAVLNVVLTSLVKRRFPQHLGGMMAAYTMAMATGSSLASGLTVAVMRAADGSVRVALGVWAVTATVALIVWLPQLRAGAMAVGRATAAHTVPVWWYPLAWHVLFFMGMQSLLYYGLLSWLPAIYRDRGLDAAEAGMLLMVFNGIAVVGNLVAPVIASRLPDQRVPVGVAISLMTTGLLGVLLAPIWTAMLWAAILGVAQGSSLSLALLVIVLRSRDSDTAAALSGMAQSGGYLLAATGPLVMGLLHGLTDGWTVPLLFLLAVAGLIWIPGMTAAKSRVI